MLLESSEKQLSKVIKAKSISIMENPVLFTRAFFYMFEKNGWVFDSEEKTKIINKFRITSSDKTNRWFDGYNQIEIDFDKSKVKYKDRTSRGFKFRAKTVGGQMRVTKLSIEYFDITSYSVDLLTSIEEGIGGLVLKLNKLMDGLIDHEKSGGKTHEYSSPEETNKFFDYFNPLVKFYNKKELKIRMSFDRGFFNFNITPTDFDYLDDDFFKGFSFSFQHKKAGLAAEHIIDKANQYGFWLYNYGLYSNNESYWLDFKAENPTSKNNQGAIDMTIQSLQKAKVEGLRITCKKMEEDSIEIQHKTIARIFEKSE